MIPFNSGVRLRSIPLATYALVTINVAAFWRETSAASSDARDRFIASYALVPFDITHGVSLAPPAPPTFATLLTSQFLHGSFVHLFFNMLFLLVFGPLVESACGSLNFVLFYLTCGVLGGLAQVSAQPGSHVPSIGASGAIAGVLGACVVRFPTVRVGTIVPIGCFPLILRLPAILVIGLWAVVQFVHGFAPVSSDVLSERGGGIAYFAHIGGFLAGIIFVGLFTQSQRKRQGPRLRSRH